MQRKPSDNFYIGKFEIKDRAINNSHWNFDLGENYPGETRHMKDDKMATSFIYLYPISCHSTIVYAI